MANLPPPLVAEVGQASDIVLFAFVLVVALVVGLALFAIDAVVGRLRHKGSPTRRGGGRR